MCRYKLMHSAAIGSVELCDSCGNLKVEVGYLLALISPKSFELILEDFIERRIHYFESIGVEEIPERVVICLNDKNLFLSLNLEEFDQMVELFQMAEHMLKVNELLGVSQ